MKESYHKVLLLVCILGILVFGVYAFPNEVEEVAQKQTMIETYLSHNDYLVQVKTKSAKATIEEQVAEIVGYMKQSNAYFDALLEESTKLNHISIDGQTLTYHFDEIKYPINREGRVWEALVYAGTQFQGIEKVALTLKDTPCQTMPLNHTPLGTQDRSIGINQLRSNQIYLHEGNGRTLYYEITIGKETYPILQTIRMKDINNYDEFLELLLKPAPSTMFYESILSEKKIRKVAPSEVKNEVLHLYFNRNILNKHNEIDQKIVSSLKQNFAQFEEIHYLSIHVKDKVISVDGKNKIALGNK